MNRVPTAHRAVSTRVGDCKAGDDLRHTPSQGSNQDATDCEKYEAASH